MDDAWQGEVVKPMRMRNDRGSFYNRDLTNCPQAAPFVTQQEDARWEGEEEEEKKKEKTGKREKRLKEGLCINICSCAF